MITLHHCVSARSFRPLWALEEIGVPYQLKMLPFPPRVVAREFMQVNPLGTIPAFNDDALFMTESAAICQYLAACYSPGALDVASHEADFGRYLNFLHFGEATLTFPQTLVLRYTHLEPPERRQPQVAEDYAKWFHARLRTLVPLLEREAFLCAGRFTAADISVGYALMLAEHIGLHERFAEPIARYWSRLRERDGFQRAMRAQGDAAVAQGVSPDPSPDMRPFGSR
ncbi:MULTISPECIES: glutathione S-transferase family protein [unclassified Caballeronia]|uniref:glutathione S-transferase family protein n=1 Tax=unclassified Caballeronia TaxID=2646786 RepID=UPI002864ECAA|nr:MULTISPECIES: glutathione S-transferase family protein [unclassified Caballeronia]MDR5773742.1 glutathione S-transferase family protein [Caballeronia sp. LZ002]MDR5849177.1 glutathione S-transferase family protein [Caballeronia sp. LZ003]